MTWRHWIGVLLGAGAGVALAVALHKSARFADPVVDEREGGIGYR